MKISLSKIKQCTSFGAWLCHETRDFLRLFGVEFDWRVYRVRYQDGAVSVLMNKYQAKNYASIFNGQIFRSK